MNNSWSIQSKNIRSRKWKRYISWWYGSKLICKIWLGVIQMVIFESKSWFGEFSWEKNSLASSAYTWLAAQSCESTADRLFKSLTSWVFDTFENLSTWKSFLITSQTLLIQERLPLPLFPSTVDAHQQALFGYQMDQLDLRCQQIWCLCSILEI